MYYALPGTQGVGGRKGCVKMNWKAEAMEKLHRYDAMRQAVKNIPEEITRLELDAARIRSARTDSTPVKGGSNKREDMLLDNMVHRQELQGLLQQAKSWICMTERALGTLTPEEKLILHRMYILPERGCLDRLSMELGLEQSSIYRRRDKALRRFTQALYGLEES